MNDFKSLFLQTRTQSSPANASTESNVLIGTKESRMFGSSNGAILIVGGPVISLV
jgi:hypothetical protein